MRDSGRAQRDLHTVSRLQTYNPGGTEPDRDRRKEEGYSAGKNQQQEGKSDTVRQGREAEREYEQPDTQADC